MSPTGTVTAAWLFGVAGLQLVGIGAYFIAVRPALLPEDLRFLAVSDGDVDRALPRLRDWLRRVFLVLGGHALAAGMLTVFVATTGIRDGNLAAVFVLAAVGAASIGVMTAVNFMIRSDYRWLLAAFASVWLTATAAAVWV